MILNKTNPLNGEAKEANGVTDLVTGLGILAKVKEVVGLRTRGSLVDVPLVAITVETAGATQDSPRRRTDTNNGKHLHPRRILTLGDSATLTLNSI